MDPARGNKFIKASRNRSPSGDIQSAREKFLSKKNKLSPRQAGSSDPINLNASSRKLAHRTINDDSSKIMAKAPSARNVSKEKLVKDSNPPSQRDKSAPRNKSPQRNASQTEALAAPRPHHPPQKDKLMKDKTPPSERPATKSKEPTPPPQRPQKKEKTPPPERP